MRIRTYYPFLHAMPGDSMFLAFWKSLECISRLISLGFRVFPRSIVGTRLCDGSNLDFLAVEVQKLVVQGHEVADCGFSLILWHLNMLVFPVFSLDLVIWMREVEFCLV